jgi:peptidoglycan-N-acetylmuramic acid deacetylase
VKSVKKLLSILLILILLCGCGKVENPLPNDQKETDEPKTGQSTPTPEPAATPVTSEAPAETPKTSKPPLPNVNTSELSNKTNGWGFRKISGARPEFSAGQISMMDKYSCIYMGGADEKVVYLTFDEGYENGYTPSILDTLKEHGVKAAFFITGPYLEKNLDLVDRMVNEGHTVGNHTVNHPSLPSVSDAKLEEELLSLDRQFFNRYGLSMKYLRPPKGEYSERTLYLSNKLGYTNVFWSFAYKDWETDNQKGADYAYNQVMPGIHNGIVILLHAVSKDNTAALGKIITDIKAAGYKFATLDEYLP